MCVLPEMPPGLTLSTLLVLLLVAVTLPTPGVRGDFVKQFRVTEGVPVGTRIGFIGAAEPGMSSSAIELSPYIIKH